MKSLRIDLDGKITPCKWLKWCKLAGEVLPLLELEVLSASVRRSPSGGVHAELEVARDLEPLEVVAVQAMLRSDPKREALNLNRHKAGQWANVLHCQRDGEEWGEPWPAGLVTLEKAMEKP